SRRHIGSEHLGVSYQRYGPNVRSPMAHSHREQEEAYVVVSGSGRVLLDGEPREVRQWDVIRVSPHVVRAFEAGPDGLELIAVGAGKAPRRTASDSDSAAPAASARACPPASTPAARRSRSAAKRAASAGGRTMPRAAYSASAAASNCAACAGSLSASARASSV